MDWKSESSGIGLEPIDRRVHSSIALTHRIYSPIRILLGLGRRLTEQRMGFTAGESSNACSVSSDVTNAASNLTSKDLRAFRENEI